MVLRVLSAPGGARRVEAVAVRVLALVALLVGTAVALTDLPRYRALGPELLRNAAFADGLDGWAAGAEVELDDDHAEEPAAVVLTNRDRSGGVTLQQPVDLPQERPVKLRLSAEVATERVVRGARPWQAARLFLVGVTADGEHLWRRHHNLVLLGGSRGWRRVSGVFEVPPEVPRVVVAADLSGAAGRMRVRGLSLVEVAEREEFRLARGLLAALWAVVLGWIGLGLWRAVESGPQRLAIAAAALTAAGVALVPEPVRTGAALTALGPLAGRVADPDAVNHLLLFALLAAVLRSVRPADPVWMHLLGLALFAAVTEVAQFFTGRPDLADLADGLVDVAGAALGIALVGLARRLRRITPAPRRRRGHSPDGAAPS